MKLSLLGYREQENSDCFIFTNSYTLLVLIILLDTTLLLEEHILVLHSSLTWAFEKRTACDKCAASLKSDLDICNHLYGEEPLKIHSTLSTPSVLHLFILISLHTFLTKGALCKSWVFCSCTKSILLCVLSRRQLVKANKVMENVRSPTRWDAF